MHAHVATHTSLTDVTILSALINVFSRMAAGSGPQLVLRTAEREVKVG
jgi:hypothetical protein